MTFDAIAVDITLRQYAQPGETTVEEVLTRAARVVGPDARPGLSSEILNLMLQKKFIPGGRILAGAGTEHGNLLNCFVQDGSPYTPGTTHYATHLAKKLAIVTRVGGGNGLNLDSFPARKRYAGYVGNAFVLGHTPDVASGTYLDLVTGARTTKGYNALLVTHAVPTLEQLSSDAMVLEVDDDTEAIWVAASDMVDALLDGMDVFIDLRKLRPEGAIVSGSGGTSSGPASFAVEIFDNFARWARLGGAPYAGPVATLRYLFAPTLRVIRQGGVRRGAGMATLSATHPDALDFIDAKDLRRELREGDISTFNMSLLMTDAFMSNVYTLGQQEVMDAIVHQAWSTGEPGLLFVDTINKHNPLAERDGPILATNPCGEIPLYPGEPCDLGAMNLSAYVTNMRDYDAIETIAQIAEDAYLCTEYLDRILDVENAPLPEIAKAIQSKRRIGLGMMGLADALIKLGVAYDSNEGREIAWDLARGIAGGALHYSRDAFVQHGAPEGLQGVLERRNVALLTVAPTGTTAMVLGTTSGIEPLFSPFIYRRVGTEYKQILHPLFKERMEAIRPTPAYANWELSDGVWDTAGWDWHRVIQAISDNHGSVDGLAGIPKEIREVFRCAHDIAPRDHVMMQSTIQNAFDYTHHGLNKTYAGNSISKTINLPQSATEDDVREVYLFAWKEELKGITVYRDGSRNLQVLNTAMSEDDGSTAASQARDEQLQDIVAATCALDGTCDT